MRLASVIAVLGGCGRLDFQPRVAGDGSTTGDSTAAIDSMAGVDAQLTSPQLIQVAAPGFVNSATASATLAVSGDNVLVVAVYWDESPDTVTLDDTNHLLWSSVPAQTIPSVCGGVTGNATGAQLYYAKEIISGPTSVNVTQTSGTQPLGLFVLEYANIALSNAIDAQVSEIAPASSNSIFMPSITTTEPAVIVAFFNDTINGGTLTGTAGWTTEALDVGFPNLLEDREVGPGTYPIDGALPAGQNDACWVGIAVAFAGR